MTGLRILARRGSFLPVLGGTMLVLCLLMIADIGDWYGSSARVTRALLRDTGIFAVAPVAAIAAAHFVRRGRRVNVAPDLVGARSALLLLMLRVALGCAGAAVGFVLTAAVCLVAVDLTGKFASPELQPLVIGGVSVTLGALWGAAVGIAWPKPWAPVAAAAAVYALSQVQLSSETGIRFSWPTARLHVYERADAVHFLAFAAVLASGALLTLAIATSKRGTPFASRTSTLARVAAPLGATFLVAASMGWVAGQNPAGAVQLLPTASAHCLTGSPVVCVWPDNVATAAPAQRALASAHAVLGTWPSNLDAAAPRFVEVGIDRTQAGQVIAASPLDFWGSRLGGDQRPSFLNIANNWKAAQACGAPRKVDSNDVLDLLDAAYAAPIDIEKRREELGLAGKC